MNKLPQLLPGGWTALQVFVFGVLLVISMRIGDLVFGKFLAQPVHSLFAG